MTLADNTFNTYSTLLVVRDKTPELLAEKIRKLSFQLLIDSFGQDDNGAYAYFRITRGNIKRAIKELNNGD